MGILQHDIIKQEQLSIRDCFVIENGVCHEQFRESIVDGMNKYIMNELCDQYDRNDPLDPKLFSAIVKAVPGIIGDYLYENGHITKVDREAFILDAVHESPFWGVPEVPQFSTPIRLRLTEKGNWFRIHISNMIWESRWKGIDPIAYDKFIGYMRLYWHSNLGFAGNPDPWETLQDIINNPQNYEHIMR